MRLRVDVRALTSCHFTSLVESEPLLALWLETTDPSSFEIFRVERNAVSSDDGWTRAARGGRKLKLRKMPFNLDSFQDVNNVVSETYQKLGFTFHHT